MHTKKTPIRSDTNFTFLSFTGNQAGLSIFTAALRNLDLNLRNQLCNEKLFSHYIQWKTMKTIFKTVLMVRKGAF